MITDEKILITGVTGVVGRSVAMELAPRNEVWGLARFAAPADRAIELAAANERDTVSHRQRLEAAGVTLRPFDLVSGDVTELPDDFTYVLHLSWLRAEIAQLETALRANVEGPGLLLQHCRNAKAALIMSGMGIYTGNPDPWHAYTESDPIGRGATAYAATSPASKLGIEAVARFCARAFDLPIVITRLNTVNGVPETFPGKHISAVLNGETMVAPSDPNPHRPIHLDDINGQLEAMLDAARTPATITNWCGDDVVTAQQMIAEASAWSGKPGSIEVRAVPGAPAGTMADNTKRLSITGPCRTNFADAYRKLYDEMVRA
ncbi:MAG: NAD(P)-dependent oxidoreductase [Ilumatobacteraceae bacterium]